ncbi:MAG: YihY family inner membrane protein [Desulfobulbus sp.]|nr:YihY family inner membrane protein [Desulfobulbus sp.]
MPTHSRYRRIHRPFAPTDGIIRRFFRENMLQTSAALAFTTLLALVPLVAVILAVAGTVPYFDLLLGRLQRLLYETLLPSGTANTIAGGIGRFSHRAQGLTVFGLLLLGLTAFMLLNTIERTFNHLWRVEPRPLLARLGLYAFVMAVWPFILGAIALTTSLAVSISLGIVDWPDWVRLALSKGTSLLLLGLFFAFLYYAVPNARVTRRAALAGGAFAALAVVAMQKLFEIYLGASGMFRNIYGALAAVPIFLVWLHLSWAIVLFGGLLAAKLNRPEQRR